MVKHWNEIVVHFPGLNIFLHTAVFLLTTILSSYLLIYFHWIKKKSRKMKTKTQIWFSFLNIMCFAQNKANKVAISNLVQPSGFFPFYIYVFFCSINCMDERTNTKLQRWTNTKLKVESYRLLNNKGSSIKYVRKIFRKTNISNPLIRTRTYVCVSGG